MATKGNVVSLNKSTEEHVQDETDQKTAWFAWAEEVLKPQFKKLEDATTREELEAIQFDVDDLAVIMAIQQMLIRSSPETLRAPEREVVERHSQQPI